MKSNKIKSILNEVLNEIQPDKNYEKEIFERLNAIIKKINKNQNSIKAVLGGSGAKGTWLKTFDADIFVLFDYKKYKGKSGELSDILEKTLKKGFRNIIRLHGSRDYFQIKEGKFTFEIVPILKITKAEQAKNITDVSPLHSKWVSKSAKIKDFRDTKNSKSFLVHKKLVNEMKLTKQFCQAQNVYGAESYIRGFSGYVCEILTVYYGSFLNLLRNSVKWQAKTVIDAEKYYRGEDVFKMVNTSKLESPLIVIDPVQKGRNAAAALSNEKFGAFRKAASAFLKKPSRDFFEKKDLKSAFLKSRNSSNKLIIINAAPLAGKIDVLGSKLMKIYEFLLQSLHKNGFKTIKSDWEWNRNKDAFFYFVFDKKPLPKSMEIEGPPLAVMPHVENFRRLHRKTYVKNNKIYSLEKRRFTRPEDLLRHFAKDGFVKERSKSVKIV